MIHFAKVSKQYGSRILYRNASFQINPGEKIGLVGPNGAGKTTIFRILMGEEGYDGGSVSKPDRVVVGYFSQNIEEMSGKSVLQEAMTANPEFPRLQNRIQEIEKILENSAEVPLSDDAMTKILEEYGDAQAEFEQMGGYDMEARAAEILGRRT
jgi:ATP-binding cassette subfamily F protein 3